MPVSLVYSPGIPAPVVMPISDFFGLISSAVPSAWGTLSSVSAQVSSSWNIKQQQVVTSAITTWNTEFRVKSVNISSGPVLGVVVPVVHPIDWSYIPAGFEWDTDQRRSSKSSQAWDTISRRASLKPASWNTLGQDFSFSSLAWRVLQRIHSPGVLNTNFYAGINQVVVHPIDQGTFLVSPGSTWNVISRMTTGITVRFGISKSAKSVRSVSWNTLGMRVLTFQAISWFTSQAIRKLIASSWATVQRTFRDVKVTWNTASPVTGQKATTWNMYNLVRVIPATVTEFMLPMPIVHPIDSFASFTPGSEWNLSQRVTTRVTIRWGLADRKPSQVMTRWNVLERLSIPSFSQEFYPGIVQEVVHPITARTYPWQPRITWNLGVNRISPLVPSSWNLYNEGITTARVTWELNERYVSQIMALFNTRISVISQVAIKWNVGQAMQGYIRQAAMSREDFAY